jgi:hypothetical protein
VTSGKTLVPEVPDIADFTVLVNVTNNRPGNHCLVAYVTTVGKVNDDLISIMA